MVHLEESGKVVFRTHAPNRRRAQLFASFRGWTTDPVEMTLQTDGQWVVALDVPPGDHAFIYLIDEHEWRCDYAAHGVEQEAPGVWRSLLYIPPAGPPPLPFPANAPRRVESEWRALESKAA